MVMILCPSRPAFSNDCGLDVVAYQKGGRGICVGRGSEVMFSKLWKSFLSG